MNQSIKKSVITLPFFWIALTAIYLLLFFYGSRSIASFLGFVVPIGPYNFIFSTVGPIDQTFVRFFAIPLVIIVVIAGEWLLRKLNLSSFYKILAILAILFFLTIAVDLMIWQSWLTLEFFKHGGIVNAGA